MATTISSIQDHLNDYIRDTGTTSISANHRLRAITEAVKILLTESDLIDFSNRTYSFKYFHTLNYYDITTDVPDFSVPVDLRLEKSDHLEPGFALKSPRELAQEIGSGFSESSYAIEYKDEKVFLVVNHSPKYTKIQLHDCDDTDNNGTWSADTSTSDASNLTQDTTEFKQGSGSLNFDVSVSQSGNNRATISISDMSSVDLSTLEDLGSIICWVYIPDTTNFSSVTIYWGSSSTAYWSATATTDAFGASFADGWNRVKVDWGDATKTSTPDSSAIDYLRVDYNYTGSQTNDTDFRLDDIIAVRPIDMKLHYQSWYVGKNSGGTLLTSFTSTSDIPFYSGLYDFMDVYVAHKAAAILFRHFRQYEDASFEENEAERFKQNTKKRFPSSSLKPGKNFKIAGLRW